jgi:hypothetical protein
MRCCTVTQDSEDSAGKFKNHVPVIVLIRCGCSRGIFFGDAVVVGRNTLTSCRRWGSTSVYRPDWD